MLRYLFNRKIFEKKIYWDQYHLPICYRNRFLNIRFLLIISVLFLLASILRIWGEWFLIIKTKQKKTNENKFI